LLLLRFSTEGYKAVLEATEGLKGILDAPKTGRAGPRKPAKAP
jgi:hypothetical protein